MPIDKAKKHFLGQDGFSRMNCAQAIVCAFKDSIDLSDEVIERFRAYGGGNAPGGQCGAYFAVKYILENCKKETAFDLESFFTTHAGSTKCRDIKGLKKLSCIGCVEKSAEYLQKLG